MESDEGDQSNAIIVIDENAGASSSALNSTILDYYKKFGRKRDLEQYFSLSTAQGDVKDPTSLFWRRMKSQSDSDGEKRSESSTEVCRISIKCSIPEQEPSSSQDEHSKRKSDTESPPIITEQLDVDVSGKQSDNESVKSEGNNSLKSLDATLDTSFNKPVSPTSSITSQRKLEWDSLADVGYANETDRKNSASSLSTLERLALRQQYSNNDSQNPIIGLPAAQSTPQDENENKPKGKRPSKTTKIHSRDSDIFEVNLPQSSESNQCQPINVNLTKHISFNVESAGVTIENLQKDLSVMPEKVSVETEVVPEVTDKQVQTSIQHKQKAKTKEKSSSSPDEPERGQWPSTIPVLINLNTVKRRTRKKKFRTARKHLKSRRLIANKENLTEKSGEQVSEAESFEYMPGHIYNQNQMRNTAQPSNAAVGNKSSLESSGGLTTDSSKRSAQSFTKDLQKSINLLKLALQKRYNDTDLKQRLIKEIVQRLVKSNYKDDESTTDFLSGISFSSKKLGLSESNQTTTSNSDVADKSKQSRPCKSILRTHKFNSNNIASTSQSAPNLPVMTKSEVPITSRLSKPPVYSATESDASSKGKNYSDAAFAKTSSEELYHKYIDALKREELYKKHLRDKAVFLKQKLVSSDTALRMPEDIDSRSQTKLKELIKDLTRNNYDDGSGDASKLEGGSNYSSSERRLISNQRSHSVFTLSSNNNDKRSSSSRKVGDTSKPSHSDPNHYCCCPYHSKKGVTDSSVQVSIDPQEGKASPRISTKKVPHLVSDDVTGEIRYVCLCNEKPDNVPGTSDEYLIYKCSRLSNKSIQSLEVRNNTKLHSCNVQTSDRNDKMTIADDALDKTSKSSQTNIPLMLQSKTGDRNVASHETNRTDGNRNYIHEATRSVQTEICIDPRIAEPTLSDISIVSDADCVEFINEKYRQVSKSTIPSEVTDQQQQIITLVTPNEVPYSVPSGGDNIQNNYSIPIKGTNMTLKVSLGPNKGIKETDMIPTPNTAPFQEKTRSDKKQSPHFQKDADLINTMFTRDNFFHNIYPEDLVVNNDVTLMHNAVKNNNSKVSCHVQTTTENDFLPGLRPFLRSNTDTCLLNKVPPEYTPAYQSLPCRSQCTCPTNSSCRHLCNEFAPCMQKLRSVNTENTPKSSPRPRSPPLQFDANTQSDDLRQVQDVLHLRVLKSGSPKETRDAGCDGAPSKTKEPLFIPAGAPDCLQSQSDSFNSGEPDICDSKLGSARTKCICGLPANCKCTKDALCTEPQEPIRKLRSTSPDSPKQRSPRKLAELQSESPLPSQCVCDPLSSCNGTCLEGAPCMESDSRIHKLRTAKPFSENIPSPRSPKLHSPRKLAEYKCESPPPPQCVCDPSSRCKGSCPEGAPCMERNCRIQKLRSTKPLLENIDSDGKDNDSNGVFWSDKLKSSDSQSKGSSKDEFIPQTCKCGQASKCKGKCKTACPQQTTTQSDSSIEPIIQKMHSLAKSAKSKDDGTKSSDVIDMIKDIKNRYSKNVLRSQKKKCFKEIMSLLNYLLDTDEPNSDQINAIISCATEESDSAPKSNDNVPSCAASETNEIKCSPKRTVYYKEKVNVCCAKTETAPVSDQKASCECHKKTCVDKGIQICTNKSRPSRICYTESSEAPCSTEIPCTSSDSTTCRVLNKIKKECEKYHQKRCSQHGAKRCECSSTTSVNCESCKRVHHCYCKAHRCRGHRSKHTVEKLKKKCVAYNLIIQTSDSMISEETCKPPSMCQPLKNIIVKVPSKRCIINNIPFKEMERKIEGKMTFSPGISTKYQRSRSLPHESGLSSGDEITKRAQVYTVREYLEKNRPEFVNQSSKRQECLKILRETRASERHANRKLLSMQLRNEKMSTLNALSESDLRLLAKDLGVDLKRKKVQPKFISEQEMKKHSEKIYKSLPEVTIKKEEAKKESIKKTNLLMANIFKKNLQKKALQGAVNVSNYSRVVKI